MNDLISIAQIRVAQIPVIEERMRLVKEQVDKTIEDALSLVCTEESVQSIKQTRADLNRQFAEMEEQRKVVRAAVLAPLESFDATYKECIGNAFKRADFELKNEIATIEGTIKNRCEDGLRAFYDELCAAHGIDFAPYERAGIIVSLTDAKAKTQPPKKHRDALTAFVQRISEDVATIATLDNAAEVMVEYKRTLSITAAVGTVAERRRCIEAEQAANAERAEQQAREAEAVKKVEAFAPPVEIEPKEQTFRCQFTVTATKPQLKKLKEFMSMEGIKYE